MKSNYYVLVDWNKNTKIAAHNIDQASSICNKLLKTHYISFNDKNKAYIYANSVKIKTVSFEDCFSI